MIQLCGNYVSSIGNITIIIFIHISLLLFISLKFFMINVDNCLNINNLWFLFWIQFLIKKFKKKAGKILF